jgi:hypothetical protein
MFKFSAIILTVCLLVIAGCGEKPQQAATPAPVVETPAPVEVTPIHDPGNLLAYREQTGETMYFWVTGSTEGYVWGTDIYSDDSELGVAAVHAGVLAPGETGAVKVTVLPGQDNYTGSTRHGVTSFEYPNWYGSYRVEAPGQDVVIITPDIIPIADPGNLVSYRDHTGEVLYFQVTGSTQGSVWGTDVYTDDSSLATAAVHAGVLEPEETGIVMVSILPGDSGYTGTTRNGVTSRNYGSWSGSFAVEAP